MGPKKTAVFDKKTAVLVARSTKKDITGFFEKAACGKAFSGFFIISAVFQLKGCDTFSFLVRTEKDIHVFMNSRVIGISSTTMFLFLPVV